MKASRMQRSQEVQKRMVYDLFFLFYLVAATVLQCPCSSAAFVSLGQHGDTTSRIHHTPHHYYHSSSSSFLSPCCFGHKQRNRIGSQLNNSRTKNHVSGTSQRNKGVQDNSGHQQKVKQRRRQEIGQGRNWMEKSSPMGIGKIISAGAADCSTPRLGNQDPTVTSKDSIEGYYDMGIHGLSFQTGPLSLRMYNALISMANKRLQQQHLQQDNGQQIAMMKIPLELEHVYKMHAMDMTAREVVKAALDQNGLELASGTGVSSQDDSNQGLGQQQQHDLFWGNVDTIQLISHSNSVNAEYDSFDSAVGNGKWEPGESFNFIVRNVPARLKAFDIAKVLQSFNADGVYTKKNSKGSTHNLAKSLDVSSLKELGIENERRSDSVPCEVSNTQSVYRGDGSQSYDVIYKSVLHVDARNMNGSENSATATHVMDSLISHGCLIVDLSDGGTSYLHAYKIAKMWNASQYFFDEIQKDENTMKQQQFLPGMKPVDGVESAHAVVGYASYNQGAMKFLESRIVNSKNATSDGSTRSIIPHEAVDILEGGEEYRVKHIMDAYDVLANVGKDIVRVAVAAVNSQYHAFEDENIQQQDSPPEAIPQTQKDNGHHLKLCSDAAQFLVQELIDDGKCFSNKYNHNDDETYVSMSPHRLCRYDGKKATNDEELEEIFGAHTDTSFITLVPVAAISGLEIFDEYANKWLRPELLARDWWEDEQIMRGTDPSANTESIRIVVDEDKDNGEVHKTMMMDIEIPWHCRYAVAMPGDLLQMVSRNEIVSAVHRVVSSDTNNKSIMKRGDDNGIIGEARLSCPVLLRSRSGTAMNASKYFGNAITWNAILKESNGMTMDDIHDALQPFNYE